MLVALIREHGTTEHAGPVLFLSCICAGSIDFCGVCKQAVFAIDRDIESFTADSADTDISFVDADLPRIALQLIILIMDRNVYFLSIRIEEVFISLAVCSVGIFFFL